MLLASYPPTPCCIVATVPCYPVYPVPLSGTTGGTDMDTRVPSIDEAGLSRASEVRLYKRLHGIRDED